ncbi:MAG: hypothetical protein KGZ63_01585 [Clostridiales bacterium]|jgi:succinate dehydrogenase/fumarate reductase iron-sulfur protein|nr:hypothetical protein [Clostridiales bacterium]
MSKEIKVTRYMPQTGEHITEVFPVPAQAGATVLQTLQYIYEEHDSSLAFRYGCRYNHCGLCGVSVDGKPTLACKKRVAGVREVAPLPRLPLLRDLAVDRSAYFRQFQDQSLYPVGTEPQLLGPLCEDALHRNLMSCLECLCCVSSCPEYNYGEEGFAGPYLFIKLAQLHLDPRDKADRITQSLKWGIERCKNCKKCICPNGIKLKQAIQVLL